jgi:hypothetical protein
MSIRRMRRVPGRMMLLVVGYWFFVVSRENPQTTSNEQVVNCWLLAFVISRDNPQTTNN